MTSSSNDPWRCAYCKRLNKALAEQCGACKTRWDRCIDIYFTPGKKKEQEQSQVDWAGRGRHQGPGRRGQTRSASRRQQDAAAQQQDSPRQRNRPGRGKKAKEKDQYVSPFQPIGGQPPPWPGPDTAFTRVSGCPQTSPFAPQAPLPPPTSPPPPSPEAHNQLVVAVKKLYPDLSKTPAEIREALEKSEAMSTQQVAAALHRATNQVRQSNDKMRELRESQVRHKDSWQKHLKEAIACWEGQVQAYTDQQKAYKEMMAKHKANLQIARKDIQRLNHMAAGSSSAVPPVTVDLTEPDEIVIDDSESLVLMEQLTSVLNRCTQMFTASENGPTIVSDDEAMEQPASKRPRSVEPDGAARGGASTFS